MTEKNEVQILQEQVAELRAQIAELRSGSANRGDKPLSARAQKAKEQIAGAKNVKFRVARFVKGKGPPGTLTQVAQPIVLGPRWRKLWSVPSTFPSVLTPTVKDKDGQEVPAVYEAPEPVVRALGPDVQLV